MARDAVCFKVSGVSFLCQLNQHMGEHGKEGRRALKEG